MDEQNEDGYGWSASDKRRMVRLIYGRPWKPSSRKLRPITPGNSYNNANRCGILCVQISDFFRGFTDNLRC
jgi:hypothetical protein